MFSRSLLLVTALVSAHAAVDCGNGNQCADGQTCLGRLSAPNGTIVGLKYGCSAASLGPTPTLCPAGVYSCPSGNVCVVSKNQFLGHAAEVVYDCAPPSVNATVTSSAKINPSSKSIKAPRKATICSTISPYLFSSCSCGNNGAVGAVVECSYTIPYLTTVGIKFTLKPCSVPATAGMQIYGGGISYSNSVTAGIPISKFPVPGASGSIPGLGGVGMYLSFSISGSISRLSFKGDIDACGSFLGITKCGSSIVSGLPVNIMTISASFSSVCDTPSSPTPAPPTSRRRRASPTPTYDDDRTVDDDSAGQYYYEDPYLYYCRSDEVEIMGQTWIAGGFCSPWCQGSAQNCPSAVGATARGMCSITHSSGDKSCSLLCSEDGAVQDYTCPMDAQCYRVDTGDYGLCTYDGSAAELTKSGKSPPTGLKLLSFKSNNSTHA